MTNELEGISLKNRKPEPMPESAAISPELEASLNSDQPKKSKAKPIIIAAGIVAVLGIAGVATWAVINNSNNGSSTATVTSADGVEVKTVSGDNKITAGGIYTYTGTIDGRIIIDTTAEVTIILKDVTITDSEENAAIKSEQSNTVKVVLEGTNKIKSAGDGFNVTGNLEISGSGNITIESGDDAIHADSKLTISGGTYNLTAAEGLEATYITINDGTFTISASDDGINAAQKVDTMTPTIEINGGNITIKMGAGDTDAIDSNGNLYINGGTLDITAQSAFDYDGEAKLSSDAKVTVNGTQITSITSQMMGPGAQGGQMMTPDGQSGEMPEMTDEMKQEMQSRMQNGGQMRQRGQMAQ